MTETPRNPQKSKNLRIKKPLNPRSHHLIPPTCMTSSIPSSLNPPALGSYSCVPLMITVCAGRFTPHASVAVHTSTFTTPSLNIFSVRVRSARSIPAWWMPKPDSNSSASSRLRDLPTSFCTRTRVTSVIGF